jgi:2-aminoethylphosphonate-pyruvate transaminase
MIIFSPGPANITESVRAAMNHPDICHRDTEFGTLLADIRRLLSELFLDSSDGYRVAVLTGSGSAAIESVVAAARQAGRMLVVSNGSYGERAAAMGRYHGTDVVEHCLQWGEKIDAAAVARAADECEAGSVYLVHHETTTGRLNDLAELTQAARAGGDRMVLVDAVSSIAGESLPIPEMGLDAVIGSANKCIRGVPGASFVLTSRRFAAAAAHQAGPHYTNLATHLDKEDEGETPFTPGVPAMFAFRQALWELEAEGVAKRIAHFVALSERLQEGMLELGFRPLLDRAEYGHTLLSYRLPEGWRFRELHADLKRRGFVIYGAQGGFKEGCFRLGLVGSFGLDAVEGFLDAMRETL